MVHFVYPAVYLIFGSRRVASRTLRTRNSVGMRSRYRQIRSKFVSDARWVRADATAYCAAGESGTGSPVGFSRMASMFGRALKVRRKAENSVPAPAPTAPAN